MAAGPRRNSVNPQRGLVLFVSLLAAVSTCFSLLGFVIGRPEIAIFALPLTALFGKIAWMLTPRGLSSYRPGKLAAAQDRLFDTKVMRRLVPPPRQREDE